MEPQPKAEERIHTCQINFYNPVLLLIIHQNKTESVYGTTYKSPHSSSFTSFYCELVKPKFKPFWISISSTNFKFKVRPSNISDFQLSNLRKKTVFFFSSFLFPLVKISASTEKLDFFGLICSWSWEIKPPSEESCNFFCSLMEISSAKWLSEMVKLYVYVYVFASAQLPIITDFFKRNLCFWFHQELESAFMDDFQMNPFECTLEELSFQTFSDESYTSHADLDNSSVKTPPAKQPRTAANNRQIASMAASSSSSHIISFGNSHSAKVNDNGVNYSNVKPKFEMGCEGNIDLSSVIAQGGSNENQNYCSQKYGQGIKRGAGCLNRSPLVAQDHVLAERKRREKLSQRFVALSALIPHLKKVTHPSFSFLFVS